MALTREQAIELLTSLPTVERIAVADLRPTDVLVVECDGYVDGQSVERLTRYMEAIWPNHKAVVFGKDARLRIVREFDLDDAARAVDAALKSSARKT